MIEFRGYFVVDWWSTLVNDDFRIVSIQLMSYFCDSGSLCYETFNCLVFSSSNDTIQVSAPHISPTFPSCPLYTYKLY